MFVTFCRVLVNWEAGHCDLKRFFLLWEMLFKVESPRPLIFRILRYMPTHLKSCHIWVFCISLNSVSTRSCLVLLVTFSFSVSVLLTTSHHFFFSLIHVYLYPMTLLFYSLRVLHLKQCIENWHNERRYDPEPACIKEFAQVKRDNAPNLPIICNLFRWPYPIYPGWDAGMNEWMIVQIGFMIYDLL